MRGNVLSEVAASAWMKGQAAVGADAANLSADASFSAPRVLQVITKLDLGGAESVAMDLTGALRDEVRSAVFAVFSLPNPSRVGRDMAERLQRWQVPLFTGTTGHFKTGGALVAAWRLAGTVRRWRPDVVHLHTEVPELTYALATVLSPRLRRTPTLRTIHNSELWIDWGRVGHWVTRRLAAGRAIAVSEAAAEADLAIATVPPRPRPVVVPNGVNPPPQFAQSRSGPYRLLFAARFVPAKGGDLVPAILAAAHARSARRDVEVTIAGSGPQEEVLRCGLQGVAPEWTIHVVPPIEQLSQRLADWDGVLMPSRFEGLPLLAVEALMAGTPVAATRAPGLVEAFPPDYPLSAPVDDVDALGDVVARMIDQGNVMRDAVAAFRPWLIDRFSPQAMARAYLDTYRTLAHEAA